MSAPILGLSISADAIRAVLWWRESIQWAGTASYTNPAGLADVIAHLAAEAGLPVRRAHVVLERDVVQLRSVVPAPPVRAPSLRGYVELEAPRLFRRNGSPLITDGVLVALAPGRAALWAGAAAEPLVRAALTGCAQAGLTVEALGPAADVLPRAAQDAGSTLAFPNGGTTELVEVGPEGAWRSRLVPLAGEHRTPELTRALSALGADASHFAAAYGAAVARSRLSLLPGDVRAAHERAGQRRLAHLIMAGAVLWVLAAGVYLGRLAWTRHAATAALGTAAPAVDSALAVRRQVAMAEATLATIATAERTRSRHLALLAAVTRALDDSTHVVALQVTPEGTVRIGGYAPIAARAVAALERVPLLRDVRLEGPVSRERDAGNVERDRFAAVARLRLPGAP